jgi:hypothetical protein
MLPDTATGTGHSCLCGSESATRYYPDGWFIGCLSTLPVGKPGQFGSVSITSPVVHLIEADSIDDLIADCAQIPSSVRATGPHAPSPRLAPAWEVTDGCRAQVEDLDEYV